MIKDILLVSLLLLTFLFIVAYATAFEKISSLNKECAKLFIDNATLKKFIDEEINNNKSDQEVHKENFIKFLAESRDWAFTYIENVQSGLKDFVENIEPEINYFKEYGDIASMQPNYYSMKKIVEEYEKLKKLLPSEEEEVK